MGDQSLNNLAAHTYNAQLCDKIFAMIEKALSPTDYSWKTLHKALMALHTIVLYGSELAVDKAVDICRFTFSLQEYNSALVKKNGFFTSAGGGGMDYGAPVRAQAKILSSILMSDESIRRARAEAREGQESLVPMGDFSSVQKAPEPLNFQFGAGATHSVGAGFGMDAIPGRYVCMYFYTWSDVKGCPVKHWLRVMNRFVACVSFSQGCTRAVQSAISMTPMISGGPMSPQATINSPGR